MNLEQAEKSMEIAKKAMDVMDYEKAIKFIRKSINLHPTEEAQRLLFECKAQQERQEKSQKPAATEAALPLELPPGILSNDAGFLQIPKALFSPEAPQANSSILVIPIIIASSACNLSITVAL